MLALVAALLGYAGVSRTAAYVARTGDIERAHALAPGDGRITGLYAQSLSGAEATAPDRLRADRFARRALRRDPTAVTAVATLGLDAQIRGDTAGARRLFAYAEQLSRRDLRAQIWSIEDAVGRGDVAGALHHYDIALRTSRDAQGLLFPILASAIADPTVRTALAGTLARRPAWASHFIGYAAGEGLEPRAAARLFADLRRAGAPVPDTANAALVDRLIGSGFVAEAWSLYAMVHRGADRRMSRDPGFAADTMLASLFDWRPADAPGITVSLQRAARGGFADFAVMPGLGGMLVQQMQVLPPGAYRLDGRSGRIDQSPASLPYWQLRCRDGRELGRVVVPPSRQANGVFAGRFVVPADCPVQTLSLVARPSDALTGTAGQIDRARLAPVR